MRSKLCMLLNALCNIQNEINKEQKLNRTGVLKIMPGPLKTTNTFFFNIWLNYQSKMCKLSRALARTRCCGATCAGPSSTPPPTIMVIVASDSR